jgi:hypothetical protein
MKDCVGNRVYSCILRLIHKCIYIIKQIRTRKYVLHVIYRNVPFAIYIIVFFSKLAVFPGMAFGGGIGGIATSGTATGSSSGSGQTLAQVDHVRTVFPETWLWTNTTTGYT